MKVKKRNSAMMLNLSKNVVKSKPVAGLPKTILKNLEKNGEL